MRFFHSNPYFSRRELVGLGFAGLLTSLRPKSVAAGTDDEGRASKIFFRATRHERANVAGEDAIFTIDPETDSWQFVIASIAARASHDGKHLIYIGKSERGPNGRVCLLLDLETGESKFFSDELTRSVLWSSDDRRVLVSGSKHSRNDPAETWIVDAADPARKTKLPIGDEDKFIDWSPDDKTLLVVKGKNERGESIKSYVEIWDLEGKNHGRVIAPSPGVNRYFARFNADGKRVCFPFVDVAKKESGERSVGLDGKDERILVKPRENLLRVGPVAWSPDGKRFAASLNELAEGADYKAPYRFIGSRIEIFDASGKRTRRLALPDDFDAIRLIEWCGS